MATQQLPDSEPLPAAGHTAAAPTRPSRLIPVAGLIFVVLFLVSFCALDTPEGDAGDEEWLSYWRDSDHRVTGLIASLAMLVAAVAMLWFVAGIRRHLAGAAGSEAAHASGVAAGSLMLIAGFGAGIIPIGHNLADIPIPDDPDIIRLADSLYYGVVFLPLPYALAGFMLPLFWAMRGTGLAPDWLRIGALVAGIVALSGPFLFVVPHLLFVLWTLALSIILLLRGRRRAAPR